MVKAKVRVKESLLFVEICLLYSFTDLRSAQKVVYILWSSLDKK